MSETSMYELNPLERFSNRAEDYAKYRPSYPNAVIDKILVGMRSPAQLLAADVGAGTGISSRLLAERGVRVLAIEPNATMRQAATSHPLVEFRDATAQATGLTNSSVDLVTCFQSFHWFNPEPTLAEFHRILKPSGKLALIWNYLDASDKFTTKYIQIVNRAEISRKSRSSLNLRDRLILIASETFKYRHQWQFRILSNFLSAVRGASYRQELDISGLIGLAKSQSFVSLSESVQQQLIANVSNLYQANCQEGNCVYLAYRTIILVAIPR